MIPTSIKAGATRVASIRYTATVGIPMPSKMQTKAEISKSRKRLVPPSSTKMSDKPKPIPVTFKVPMTIPAAAAIIIIERTV